MENVAAAMRRMHELCGEVFDRIMWCQHHPMAKTSDMAVCWCRKPRIGGLVQMMVSLAQQHDEFYPPHMALFVGDREEDRGCADGANVPFMWAKDWRATVAPPEVQS
jgi:D-glycero-D-manno-heptose 1,7-bisphosphate phosphatase